MPLFVMYGLDGARGPEIRKTTRPAHLDWVNALGIVKVGGPMYAEDGTTPIGSLIVIEAKDLADAKRIFAEDPYRKAGLWDRVDIRQFNWIAH
jgi:uncharacterized protein YciI